MFDIIVILKTLGYFGLAGIIFAETGLLVGFFLPGDSLLFTAGILTSLGYFNLLTILIISFIAAVLGEMMGYWFGKRYGHKIFNKPDSLLFHQDHIKKSEEFFKKHGGKSILLARFVPLVRTAIPILAGVGKMDYKVFTLYNIVGGFLWTSIFILAGFYLGEMVPNAEHLILPIILGVVILSVLPFIISILRDKNQRKKLRSLFKK
jgi:membrane-associated protein